MLPSNHNGSLSSQELGAWRKQNFGRHWSEALTKPSASPEVAVPLGHFLESLQSLN